MKIKYNLKYLKKDYYLGIFDAEIKSCVCMYVCRLDMPKNATVPTYPAQKQPSGKWQTKYFKHGFTN